MAGDMDRTQLAGFVREFPDRTMKLLLGQPWHFAALLEILGLPAGATLVAGSLRREESQAIDPKSLALAECDVAFLAEMVDAGGLTASLRFVVESQLAFDPWMAVRLALRSVVSWEHERRSSRLSREGQEEARVTPVQAIVVHLGLSPWPGPIDMRPVLPAEAGPLRGIEVQSNVLLLDLGSEEGATRCRSSLQPLGGVLWSLRVIRGRDPAARWEAVREATRRVAAMPPAEHAQAQELVAAIIGFVTRYAPRSEIRALLQLVETIMGPGWREEVKMIEDAIEGTFVEEHRLRGRAEGRAEGELHARRDMLLRLMQARFGPVPDPVRSRVESTVERAVLDRWLETLIHAESIAEIGIC